jgi:hypothetical protein
LQVGPTYGRGTITGLLASEGFRVCQILVGHSLQRVDPTNHHCITRRSINPIAYRSAYFGEKLHIDQNEKLILFGVTHVCAIDGFSGKVVGFVTMPI